MCRAFALVALLALTPAAPGQVRRVLRGFPSGVYCIAFSPDGKILATSTSASEEGNDGLRLWDVATGKELCRLGAYKRAIHSMAFAPDGKTLVTPGSDDSLYLWDLATRKVRRAIKTRRGAAWVLAVSPDSKLVAGCSFEGLVTLWDMGTGRERGTMTGLPNACSLRFSPDGRILAGSGGFGTVVLWDVASRKLRATLAGHEQGVYNVAFSPDGKVLYTLSPDFKLIRWDVADGKAIRTIDLRKRRLAGYAPKHWALSPDGRTIATMGPGRVRLFDLQQDKYRPGIDWRDQDAMQWCVAFSPDGKLLATGAGKRPENSTVYLWDVPPAKKKSD
jgi:WD40 repeat protein